MPTLNEDEIKRRAHQIWEREGRPEGRDFQNYMDAVAELTEEEQGDRPTTQPGISTNLHPGGVLPAGGAPSMGSVGTGGAATAGRDSGSVSGRSKDSE